MTIQVSEKAKQSLLGGPENMVTELKTSIFFAPGETIPGVKQYYQIAKTIAGFVNGEGGVLWLGVDDDGQPKGVEGDLVVLGGGSARSCKGPLSNDEGMAFGGTADKYILKLNALDAATFDALPGEKDFAKWFVAVLPHKKYAGFSKTKFGSQANIRAKELANKVYFINPDYIVHKLLAKFNIEPTRVALRG